MKIGELSRRSGVPVATIKHYLREGLIAPTRKSGRTMSWYHPDLVARLRSIKELQERRFLPLDVIRETLDRDADAPDDLAAAEAIARVLSRHGGKRSRTRAEILARGADPRELAILQAMGLAVPVGPDQAYRDDDLAVLSTLGAARRAGITADMLPFEILDRYLAALRALVAIELEMFRTGVFPRARREDLPHLTTAATELSERLVVLLRRKLLLPTLERLREEDRHESEPVRAPAVHRSRRVRRNEPARGVHPRRGHGRRRDEQ